MHNLPDLPPPHTSESYPDQTWFSPIGGLTTASKADVTLMAFASGRFAQLGIRAARASIDADLTPNQLRHLAAMLIQAAAHVEANTSAALAAA
jgi:hypothetical protein